MHLLLTTVIAYAAFVVQTSLVPLLGWDAFSPQLAIAVLVGMTWRMGGRFGLMLAAIWGLIIDGLSAGPLGIGLVGCVISAWGVQWVRSRWPACSPLLAGLMTGAATFTIITATVVLERLAQNSPVDWELIGARGAATAASTAILATGCMLAFQLVRGTPRADSLSAASPFSNRWRMLTE